MAWFCPKGKKQIDEQDSERRPHYNEQTCKIHLQKDEESIEESTKKMYGVLSHQGQFWKIDSNKYKMGKWDQIFKESKSLQARYLKITVPEANILKDISHIHFPNIIALYLSSNKIISVECLQHLHAPNLLDLDLRGNDLSQIKSLRKCSFRLEHLFLQHNPLVSLKGLSQIAFRDKITRKYVTSHGDFGQNLSYNKSINLMNVTELAKFQSKYVFSYIPTRKIEPSCVSYRQLMFLSTRIPPDPIEPKQQPQLYRVHSQQ